MSMVEWVQTDFKQVEWKEMGWRDSNDTTDFPGSLALLWPSKLTDAGVLKSAKGVAPTFTDVPTLSAGGVVPGDGPGFTDVVTWSDSGTLVVEFTATTASADLVGDVQVFGPLYVASTGLKAKDGTNTASVVTSWGVGDVVTGVVQVDGDVMTIRRDTDFFTSSLFSAASVDNKLKYSQDFSNAVWGKSAGGTGVVPTVIPNYGVAPDGTQTAARVQLNKGAGTTASDFSSFRTFPSYNATIVKSIVSAWVKTNDGSEKIVSVQDPASYQAGQVLATGDWQRVSDICTSGSGTNRGFKLWLAGGTYGTAQAADLLIWHPSLMEMGASGDCPYPEYLSTVADFVTASRYLRNTYDVACWGDSLTYGPTLGSNIWPFTRPLSFLNGGLPWIYNGGVSSETSTQIKTRMLALAGTALFADAVTVIWAGRNNYAAPETVKADVEAMVNAVASKKFIVISILNVLTTEPAGSGAYNTIQGINAYFASLWPDNFIDITTTMFAGAGTRNDGLHLTYSSQQAFAKILDSFIKSKGWSIGKRATPTDSTLPALTLAPTCPGDLKQVQEWKKVASANEISRY